MKNKFLILTLCFTIIFTSINYKKSYADGGLITVPMVATLATLAVASGIVLTSDDDILDISKVFYNKYADRWEEVKAIFDYSVAVASSGAITVGKDFLNLVKDCFDTSFNDSGVTFSSYGLPITYSDCFVYPLSVSPPVGTSLETYELAYSFSPGNVPIIFATWVNGDSYKWNIYFDSVITSNVTSGGSFDKDDFVKIAYVKVYQTASKFVFDFCDDNLNSLKTSSVYISNYEKYNSYVGSFDIPYTPGSYSPDGLLDQDKVDVYVPGDLSVLPGLSPGDVVSSPSYDLPVGGVVTLPGIDNPSIDVDTSISFPNVEDAPTDTPTDTPFANITDYIVSLVVPSDSYWTDTFGGLYNNFTSSFPMVDMDNFNNLVTGEKKFPNIDVNIMGVKGRIVNGDVINSIVDWLRPIIAGFMMLCLMLFNYRKIYKTIRGVEPFQGIAQGTSDFRTGISEYNYMGTGLSKSEYEANQNELAKALRDYEADTGKTYKIKI